MILAWIAVIYPVLATHNARHFLGYLATGNQMGTENRYQQHNNLTFELIFTVWGSELSESLALYRTDCVIGDGASTSHGSKDWYSSDVYRCWTSLERWILFSKHRFQGIQDV